MSDLKLAKLPDRVPVKMTFTAQPDLAQTLREYAAIYRTVYGEAESVEELIPFMLASFLESDRGFAKARKGLTELPALELQLRRGRKRIAAQDAGGKAEEV
jgi:hypothetical protein